MRVTTGTQVLGALVDLLRRVRAVIDSNAKLQVALLGEIALEVL